MVDTIVPIRAGIPRFVPDDAYVESFGYQWNKFNVRIPQEDKILLRSRQVCTRANWPTLECWTPVAVAADNALTAGLAGAKVLGVDRSSLS